MAEASIIEGAPMTISGNFADVQCLLRFGHGHMPEACFFLLQVADGRAARSWLAAAPITPAESTEPRPDRAIQVAFTCDGLKALGLPEDAIAGFSAEFLSGMAGEPSRSRRLGDVGANDPLGWAWGGPKKPVHLLVAFYADRGRLEEWTQSVQGESWQFGFRVLDCLPTTDLGGKEPFGFADGISQPVIDWDRARSIDGAEQASYGNIVALGEFMLGYPNEYGEYEDRPLLAPDSDPELLLPAAEDDPTRRDLGRDGTYMVFRQLEQDVREFWRFADQQANSDPVERRRLAEAMVGRTMEGTPLVAIFEHPIEGVDPDPKDGKDNRFTYDSDPEGLRCPYGAHIRRANPRNTDLPVGTEGLVSRLLATLGFGGGGSRDDLVASTRFHRILRRGRAYGGGLSPVDAVQPPTPDAPATGLHFICLNANIARQFEFVQNAWIMGTKFNGLTEESDPLIGNRQNLEGCRFTDSFSMPQPGGLGRRITGIPQFVKVIGGAYFFVPSLPALRFIARNGE